LTPANHDHRRGRSTSSASWPGCRPKASPSPCRWRPRSGGSAPFR